MKGNFWSNYRFLILALVFCALAVALEYANRSVAVTLDQAQVESVNHRLARALEQATKDQTKAIDVIKSKGLKYSVLVHTAGKYPLFVYQKSGKLAYWSDYRFVPNWEQLPKDTKKNTAFLSFPQGQFVVLHQYLAKEKVFLYSFIPIYWHYKIENDYLKSAYNQEIIGDSLLSLSQTPTKARVTTPDKAYLFSLKVSKRKQAKNLWLYYTAIIAASLAFISLGLATRHWVDKLCRKSYYELGFLLWLAYFVMLRGLMFYYAFPYSVFKFDLFNPRLYASSAVSASAGDLLFNLVITAFLLHYVLRHYHHSFAYKVLSRFNNSARRLISISLVFLNFLAAYGLFYVLSTIFLHSKLNLDISKNLDFSLLGLVGVLIFIAISIIYFFVVHILSRVFMQLNPSRLSSRPVWVHFTLGSLLYLLFAYFSNTLYLPIFIINALYFLVIYFLKLPKALYRFNYTASIYLFVGAFACALTGAYTVYVFSPQKSQEIKRKFANSLLPGNDNYAEFVLDESLKALEQDVRLTKMFRDSTVSYEQIQRYILENHLSSYFDSYQIQILPYRRQDAAQNIKPNSSYEMSYEGYRENYHKIYYETDYENVMFINNPGINLIKRYLGFAEINNDKKDPLAGYVVIDLKQRRSVPNNVYPELLVDQSVPTSIETRDYSYAVYDDNHLVYSVGTYNYEKYFDVSLFTKDELTKDELLYNGSNHLAVWGGFKRIVVVSNPAYSVRDIFSNFAFLLLLLILCIVGAIIVVTLVNRYRNTKASFSTRIQIYLNIAFFLPLFTVSLTTLSILRNTYQEDFNNSFINKTEGVGLNIAKHLEDYRDSKKSQEALSQAITDIAQYVEVDVNVFDPKGKLIASSQPGIYERGGVLSPYINPKALFSIKEERNRKVLLPESVGKLQYKSVYVPIKSYENELLGIVSIPFFDAKYNLDRKLMDVLSTIINIFASIFIVFLVLSYFAAQILTVPLRLITQTIRKTTFNNYSQPLEWDSNDEIGLFITEYNKMLKKLDDSKEALARSQKESAWREMARQVAHEIKNPLTPMKLTLQHMQVRLEGQSDKIKSLFTRSFDMLLTQIETLSDIATSFSSFAKMPIPKTERFEIAEVMRGSRDLYESENIQLETEIAPGNYYVRGDKKLMGRIFTNLIKNAIESVPEERQAHIRIRLSSTVEGVVKLAFHDNGSGIPEDLQDKVFIPNFSTKSTGSGIGLAVAKRGIEHAGGRIWFETEADKGTSFFIELPLVD